MLPVGNTATTSAQRTHFGLLVLFLLSGYALLGRGFAYAGVPPVFVGEIGLFFGALMLLTRFYVGLLRSAVTWLLIVFMLWGAMRTIPYLSEYGATALRDGAIWGYALYSLAVATVVLRYRAIESVVDFYAKAAPIFLLAAPLILAVSWFAADGVPRWPWGPGGGVSMINVKTGDMSVHYAGVFAFLALGVAAKPLRLPWMALWLLGALPLFVTGRGTFLTLASAMLLVVVLSPTLKYSYLLLSSLFLLLLLYVVGFEIDLHLDNQRTLSVGQLLANVQSIFSTDGGDVMLEGTKQWRQEWWSKIFDYTFFGPEFWTGKGFGINLADADGFQVYDDHSLRSPHSVHMTVLARAGVPGLVLWFLLQASFGLTLFVNFWRDRRANRLTLANIELWTLLYWLAFLVNGTFDVFLEGPQGGIWFWSVFGFGLALIVARREALPVETSKVRTVPFRAGMPRKGATARLSLNRDVLSP